MSQDIRWKQRFDNYQKALQNLKGQCLLGNEQFLKTLLLYLEQKREEKEIPGSSRFADRPSLGKLFQYDAVNSLRDKAITQTHVQYGYSQQEIAVQVGLHYSTVSRIIQRERRKSNSKTCPPTLRISGENRRSSASVNNSIRRVGSSGDFLCCRWRLPESFHHNRGSSNGRDRFLF
jgi:hypothetical protein